MTTKLISFSSGMITLMPMCDDDLRETDSPMKRSAALFLMKAKNEGRLTQSALRDVTNGTSSLCQQVIEQVKRKMSHIIDGDWEIQPEKKREICAHIDSVVMGLFEGLESEYLQEKYYKDKFGYMVGCIQIKRHASNWIADKCTCFRYQVLCLTDCLRDMHYDSRD